VARWSPEARLDLHAIWSHQEKWNGTDRADDIWLWLLDFADTIVPKRWPEAPLIANARKVTKDGYIFLVREVDDEVQIIGVFASPMNWAIRAKDR
jgi:plasmid stabilization system protein ParE